MKLGALRFLQLVFCLDFLLSVYIIILVCFVVIEVDIYGSG